MPGWVYVLVASPYLLPTRSTPEALTRQYEMRHYLTEVQVSATSELVGNTIEESAINREYDITVIAVHRGVDHVTENLRHLRIREEDVLVVRGSADGLTRFTSTKGVAPLSDARLSDAQIFEEGQFLVEAIVGRNSRLIGRTLEEIDFRQRIGAFVLAIRRGGEILHDKIARTRLQFADDLLLVAPEDRLARLRHTEDLIITSRVEVSTTLGGTNWAILVILPTVVILAALGVADILKGAIVGCILLLALRAMRPNEAYRAVDWSVLFLIAAFVPVGTAMQTTGTAAFLAQGILRVQSINPDVFTPLVILSVLYLLTSLLTQTISNNATAILMAPIAIQLAIELGGRCAPVSDSRHLRRVGRPDDPVRIPDQSDGDGPRRLPFHGLRSLRRAAHHRVLGARLASHPHHLEFLAGCRELFGTLLCWSRQTHHTLTMAC